jgi:hypothetical protein
MLHAAMRLTRRLVLDDSVLRWQVRNAAALACSNAKGGDVRIVGRQISWWTATIS